jgi:hypothetical protein
LTIATLYIIINTLFHHTIMKNLSTTLRRAFLVLGIMGVAILVYTPAGAGEYGTTFAFSESDFHLHSDPSDSHSGNASSGHGLIIPLTPSVSLDLRLSSVDTGQAPTGENQTSVPPIPIPKAPGSDLRYSRLGVGLSFRF